MNKAYSLLVVALIVCFLTPTAYATPTDGVVVSIKPLHSLVSAVMGETGDASLIVTGANSPHDFHLKPSQMKALHDATVVFYIDDQFESFLMDAFHTLPDSVRKVALTQTPGLSFLPVREGGAWEAHKDHHGHHDHHGHGSHGENDKDMHLWLDPNNARRMIKTITKSLSTLYPQHRDTYKANARAAIEQIDATHADVQASLTRVQDKPFIVFHDAYQYFENAYGLNAVGSITFEPDESPSPSRIGDIRTKLKETNASCVFREPQFSDRLINTVIEGTNAKSGILDPLGSHLEAGPDLYPQLLRALANGLTECL